MERTVRAGEGQAYAVAVASLWERIGSVLARLERIADSELIQALLPEWRGSLFRVRLARLRALERPIAQARPETSGPSQRRQPRVPEKTPLAAIAATVL